MDASATITRACINSGNVKVHNEDIEDFIGTMAMQPNKALLLQKLQRISPLGGSVQEVPAVEDEIESTVGNITISLTLQTSILRLKDLLATLIGTAIKDDMSMQWPSVQPWCQVCDTFYMFLLYSSVVFNVRFYHLERVKEGRDLEDDGMQMTMKSQRICQHNINRAKITPDQLHNPSYELFFYFSACTAAVLVFTCAESWNNINHFSWISYLQKWARTLAVKGPDF